MKYVTLQVCHLYFHIIWSREQVVSPWREAHRANITGMRVVALNHSSSSNIIQHTARVLLSSSQETTTRIYSYWSYSTSYKRKTTPPEFMYIYANVCSCLKEKLLYKNTKCWPSFYSETAMQLLFWCASALMSDNHKAKKVANFWKYVILFIDF